MSLVSLSKAFEGIRKQCVRWRYRALQAEEKLEELRMHLHQVGACDGPAKRTALAYLKAEATEYHARLQNVARHDT